MRDVNIRSLMLLSHAIATLTKPLGSIPKEVSF